MPNYGSLQPLISWRKRPLPLDWDEEFGRAAPLKVEIGFGNGDYLVRSAQAEPEINYVGIELTWGSVWRALRSSNGRRLSNLRILKEDAGSAILWAFAERSVENFTALFPCPWPKRRHAKNRLFSPEFLKLCGSRLRDGGSLVVVTDDGEYRDQMLKEITLETTGMQSSLEVVAAGFDTKYERKWQAGGQQEFYRLSFQKIQHHSVSHPEIQPVKHHVAAHFDPRNFAPQSESEPQNIEFKSFLYDPEQKIAMQEVFTTDESLEQHFWVRIKSSEAGWKIYPAAGSHLLPVPSVQRALDLIRQAAEPEPD